MSEANDLKIRMGLSERGYHQFEAINPSSAAISAFLEFSKNDSHYVIHLVKSELRGHKLGTKLARSFSDAFHPAEISYVIHHPRSRKVISAHMFLDTSVYSHMRITDPEIIGAIPICQLFQEGRIMTTSLDVTLNPQAKDPFNLIILGYGKTIT